MPDADPIQTVELGQATLDRIDAMLARTVNDILSRLEGEQEARIRGFSMGALQDLEAIIKRALAEREK